MTNPADKHISDLIQDLTRRAGRSSCSAEDRAILIKEIAELRQSMNPVIVVDKQ